MAWEKSDDPRQQLPIATRPPVVAKRGDVVPGGEILHHLHIGNQAGAGEDALEQIVAEQGVLRNAALQRRLERINIVDALAGVGAFAEQVLIDVGHGGGVGVDAPRV